MLAARLHTREEIPHSVAITIEEIEETSKITRVFAAINVERNSQKGIIIGKKGNMLKEIGTKSRQQIQKLVLGERESFRNLPILNSLILII